ncbi:MAG TPA: NADPH:quinone reductase [Candidatus Yaniella excrementigallinarum]|nr:NADPH:quinone reductase [Candidatus Yaniella excrementigallinarum]
MTAETNMQAAFIRATGGTEQIEVGDLPVPQPGPTDVLVQMEATTVNHVDLFVRSGAYPTHLPFPFILGRDLVGTVVETGSGVAGFTNGDRVWTNSLGYDGRQGTFAQYALVSVERLYHLPATVHPLEAAPVLHTAATAYFGLYRETQLRPGETLFVAGGAGGVGSCVIQLAAAMGARVITSASVRDHDWCRSLGADVVLDYREDKMHQKLAAAAPEGIDIWWDTSGHHDFQTTLPLLNKRAKVVVMAGMSATPVLPVGQLYTQDVRLHGFAMSNASVADLAEAAVTINALLQRSQLQARLGATYRLAQAVQAHTAMEEHAVHGRIVVIP